MNCYTTVTGRQDCFSLLNETSLLYTFYGEDNPTSKKIRLPQAVQNARGVVSDCNAKYICIYSSDSVYILVLPSRGVGCSLDLSEESTLNMMYRFYYWLTY